MRNANLQDNEVILQWDTLRSNFGIADHLLESLVDLISNVGHYQDDYHEFTQQTKLVSRGVVCSGVVLCGSVQKDK